MIGVVIPSRTRSNWEASSLAVLKNDPDCSVFVVDDGGCTNELGEVMVIAVEGVKPFVFSRNVNIGIRKAMDDEYCSGDGVVILNDDALLQTPGGFSLLAQAARENPEYGIIAATTNNVGNLNQRPRGVGLREDPRMVCFVCVYIPRTTIEKVGLLDERFVGYGLDDDDYCLRVRKAGLKIGIHDGCYVDHGSLKSSYRGDPKTPADYRPNLELFKQKWGHDNYGVPA